MLDDWAGFGVRGYRSFGDEDLAYVGPMEKVHLVVGRNNVGKSNLLHAMHDLIPALGRNRPLTPASLFPRREDTPIPWQDDKPRAVALGLRMGKGLSEAFQLDSAGRFLGSLFEQEAYSRGYNGVVWLEFDLLPDASSPMFHLVPSIEQCQVAARQAGQSLQQLSAVASNLTQGSSSEASTNLGSIMTRVNPWQFIPPTAWVGAIRELTSEGSDTGLQNGRGLIPQLALLERPPIATRREDQAKFKALEAFVRDVIDDPGAHLEIPQAKDTVHVETSRGEAMSLDSLGTGISEVVMLAAVATVTQNTLVCIEEPESHLHPSLQRKLISYLHHRTNNRYLISTHSAALLNAEIASISHVTKEREFTRVENVASPATLARAVSDLGNKASDLVQSNFLVWVEGPSDRIYVNHWLNTRHPDLIEGAHYSIMFYGGALLNHLAVDDKETNEFISLLKINRKLALMIDSDRKHPSDVLNATKERIIHEMAAIGAGSWVTDGYTVENYATKALLEKAIEGEYPGKSYKISTSRFKAPLAGKFQNQASKPSKITVARAVADLSRSMGDWHPDLWPHVDDLADAIRNANDLQPREIWRNGGHSHEVGLS